MTSNQICQTKKIDFFSHLLTKLLSFVDYSMVVGMDANAVINPSIDKSVCTAYGDQASQSLIDLIVDHTDNTVALSYIKGGLRSRRNSHAISSFGVRCSSSCCVPSTFQGSSTVLLTCSHGSSLSLENSYSIPRWFS